MDLLIGDHITPAAVLAAMREQAEATAPDDMLVIFYAGHGISNRASGRSKADLMLTLPKTRMTDLGTTALPWTAIADALAEARGTVMVILDACHSGIAGSEAFTTNDDAVSALFTRAGAPMVVLAGSKGRQASLENPATKTGLFTGAIAAALAGQRTRQGRDRQGLLDLGEFYAAVKARVVNESAGRQTPWLTRNGLVGEMVLF